ncbi:MAG: hypothetical protein ABSE69_13490 [Roseiarcus sp.]
MGEQGFGEGAVAAGAIEGDIVRLRRESNEKSGGVANPRETFRMRESARTPQRICAARVQKNQVNAIALLKLLEHVVDRHGVSINIVLALQLEVDGKQEIMPVDLYAMSAVIKDDGVGALRGAREVVDRTLHARLIEIYESSDLEPQVSQFRGDVFGVVRRIGQRRHRAIRAVAHHQGDARLGARHGGAGDQQAQRDGKPQ